MYVRVGGARVAHADGSQLALSMVGEQSEQL
jgi:hypothetical protein